jgi:hypothetical protein
MLPQLSIWTWTFPLRKRGRKMNLTVIYPVIKMPIPKSISYFITVSRIRGLLGSQNGFWIWRSNLLDFYTTCYNISQITIFEWTLSTSGYTTLIHYSWGRAEQSSSLLPATSQHGHSWHRAPLGPMAIITWSEQKLKSVATVAIFLEQNPNYEMFINVNVGLHK